MKKEKNNWVNNEMVMTQDDWDKMVHVGTIRDTAGRYKEINEMAGKFGQLFKHNLCVKLHDRELIKGDLLILESGGEYRITETENKRTVRYGTGGGMQSGGHGLPSVYVHAKTEYDVHIVPIIPFDKAAFAFNDYKNLKYYNSLNEKDRKLFDDVYNGKEGYGLFHLLDIPYVDYQEAE